MAIVYTILIVLSVLAFGGFLGIESLSSLPILPLTAGKYLLVLFAFMELRKASLVWKALLLGILLVYSLLVIFLFL